MKIKTIKMSDVVDRETADFEIEYFLAPGIELRHFPGCILNFSYEENPTMNSIHCDVFPEFRKNTIDNRIVGPKQSIPMKGKANMWIVSDRNRISHEASLYIGRKCYLLKGTKIVAYCKISRISYN